MGRFSFDKVEYKRIPFFKDVAEKDWRDWKWQVRNSIRDVGRLKNIIALTDEEEDGVRAALRRFRMAITPYYLAVAAREEKNGPVWLQAVPRIHEALPSASDLDDPLHEDIDSPVPGLTHRYPDRALLLVTQICSMYCRHCTRRRIVGDTDHHSTKAQLEEAFKYIKQHKEVRDIIISGGDPLVLSDSQIEHIVKSLSAIKHVEVIRIGSRTPVVMPMRITPELCKMLSKYAPVYLNTHFNHPDEITEDSARACEMLNDHGIPVANQSVLLKDINDCPCVMKRLVQDLLKIRVRPYYIYQCDLSTGIAHFRTPVARGLQIMESLRGHTSGMAVPTFVVDAPGGGGKIPVMPNYLLSMSGDKVVFRNFEGNLCSYTQPFDRSSSCGKFAECKDPKYQAKDGPALMLMEGGPITLETESQRTKRFKEKNGKK